MKRTTAGTYVLAELDGAVALEPYAAFRVIPYHSRLDSLIPVTKIIETHQKLKEKYTKAPIWGDDGARDWEGQSSPSRNEEKQSQPSKK